MPLPLSPEAVDELEWEVVNLERGRRGWGFKLLDEVRRRADLAEQHPELGQVVPGHQPELQVRRFVIPKFGISVIVAMVEGERTIIAIAPGRKTPGYWKNRLGKKPT
jgi:hypothetical protein